MNTSLRIHMFLARFILITAAIAAGFILPDALYAAAKRTAPPRLPVNRPEGITSETDPVRHIAVSADGRWLVYTTAEGFGGGTNLWLRSADPGRVVLPRRLTDDLSAKADPAVSPDGRWVAYAGSGHDVKGDIYLLDLKAGEGVEPSRLTGRETEDGGPCFSPDGRTLYFHQAKSGETRRRIVAMDLNNRGPVRTILDGGAFPAVSPAGNRLAFVTYGRHPDGDIALKDLWSGETAFLTQDPEMDFSPAWSPDGGAVYFSRVALDTDRDGRVTPRDNAQIFRRDLSPPALDIPLPATSASVSAFSPRLVGDRLFFLSTQGGTVNCWSLPADGEIPRQADAAAQLSLAEELARKVPPDPYLALLAFTQVLQSFPGQGGAAAQAAYRMGQIYEAEEMAEPALAAYRIVETRYAAVSPEAELARIAGAAIRARTAMDRGGASAALDKGLGDLAAIAAGSALPAVKARADIEAARLLMSGDGGGPAVRSAMERLEPVIRNPVLDRSLRAEARLLKADAYAMTGLGVQSYPLYLTVMETDDPGGPWADRAVTRALDRVAETDGDLALDERVRRLRGIAAENQADHPLLAAGALNRIGDLYYAADQWGPAKNAFREVLAAFSEPSSRTAAARLSLAEILYREERFSQALSLYETEIESRPYADDIYRLARNGYIRKSAAAGEYLFRLGEVPSARSKFRELIDYDPSIVPAHRGYLRCVAAMGDIRKVLADYRSRLAEAPNDPVAIYAVALALTYLDENAALLESRKLLLTAIALDGRVPYYHQTLGYVFEVLETVHGQKGQLELALESYKKAYFLNDPRQDPANSAHLLLNMGNASFLLNHYESAFQYYTRRLEADTPFDDPATEILFYRRLGAAAFQARAPEETLAAFENAVALIDDRMAPKSASDAFGRITRYVLDRIIHPLLSAETPNPEAESLAKAESEINRELMRLTGEDVTPPPGDAWDRYERGMTALMARQKALNPRAAALAERSDRLGETGRTARDNLENMMLRTAEALRFSERLVDLKAEMMDRLGLAYQEAGEHQKAMALFSEVYALNERLGNEQNLARNRRSVAYNAYLLAGERTGKGREDLLRQALTDFSSVIDLVAKHGVPEPMERKGKGLVNIDLQVSLDETRATAAARGFTADQEIRLAETFTYRIQTELGRLDPAQKALDKQLSQYPPEGDVPDRDLYGVALLHHRAGHLAQARREHGAAFDHFRRSAGLSLTMSSPVSSALNAANMAHVLVDMGPAAADAMRDDLATMDRRVTALLALHPVPGDPTVAAAYHNRMGVHGLRMPSSQKDGMAGEVARFRRLEGAALHFHQGLAVLKEAGVAGRRKHSALQAALHLNLAQTALALNEPGPARIHFESALQLSQKGRLADLEWRALAGLGRLEEALAALRKVTVLEAGCDRLEIVRTFAPLVTRRLSEAGPGAAFNLAEAISELERFNRMAFLLGEITAEDKARLIKFGSRIERIQTLRAEAAVAEGENRQYLTQRLDQETALLTEAIGGEGAHLPEIARFSPDETTTETILTLLGLAAQAEVAAESAAISDETGPAGDARYPDLIEAYHEAFRRAMARLEPGAAPGVLALFGPAPADAAAVQAALPPDGRLIRVFGADPQDGTPVVFTLTSQDLEGEKGGAIAPDPGDYVAADAPDALGPTPGAAALSGTHLVRCLTSRKPFRRSLRAIPPMDPLPDGYETGSPHHTLVVSRPVDLFATAPTRAGRIPQRFIGAMADAGERQRMEAILSESPDVSLALLSDVGSSAGDLTAHLVSLFGIPSLVAAADANAESPFVRDFLSAYLTDSAAEALETVLSEEETVSARHAGLIGYKGMTPAEAAAFGKKRFAAYVKEGRGALGAGHPARALTLLERAVRIAKEVGAFAKYLPALYELSRESAYRAENLEKAIEYARALTDLWAASRPDSKEHAEAMLRLGILYAQDEAYAEAVPLLETASETLAALDLAPEQAAALTNLGIALENATEYDRALVQFRSAASLSQSLGKDAFMAQQQTNIGRIQDLRLSQYAVALRHYGEALEIYRNLDQPDGEAQALLDMGRCYRLLGNFPEADRHYAEALKLADALPDGERLRAKILIEQANNAWYQARYQEAFGLQREAYAIARSRDWPLMQVICRNTAGLIWWTLGDHDKALRELTTALETTERLKARDDEIATTLNNMGQVLREMGRYEAAMEKLDAAMAIDERIGSRWALAHDYRNKGLTLLRMGRPEEAAPFFRRAADEAGAIGNRINEAKALLGQGEAAFELEDRAAAATAWESALAMGREMALREVTWRALYGLARIAAARDDRASALDRLYSAIEVIEGMRADIKIEQLRDSFIANKLAVYEALVVLLADMGRPEAAFEVAERSRARNFVDLLGNQRLSLGNAVDQDLYERQAAMKSRIAEAEALLAQSTDEGERAVYRRSLAGLQDELSDLMLEIQARNPQLASLVSVSPLPAQKLTGLLEPGVVLLAYYLTEDEILLWTIRSDGLALIRTPLRRSLLAQTVLDYRRMIQNLEPLEETARQLHGWLMKPAAGAVAGADVVGIIPHNALHYLSFGTLRGPDGYVVETVPLFYLPTASLLDYTLSRRTETRNPKVLAIGNPDLDDPALSLPFAEYEVGAIGWNFPDVAVLTEDRATESWVVKNIADFGIIHLASHGEFDPVNPLFSAVKLAKGETTDGDLAASEIFGLKIDADMVVLSACQTGLGKITAGDDVIGLNRAFFYAGTHAIVSSLWRVSDVSTAMLIKNFYRQYAIHRKAESLRRAMLHVKQHYPHPGYWGAFTVVGDYY